MKPMCSVASRDWLSSDVDARIVSWIVRDRWRCALTWRMTCRTDRNLVLQDGHIDSAEGVAYSSAAPAAVLDGDAVGDDCPDKE